MCGFKFIQSNVNNNKDYFKSLTVCYELRQADAFGLLLEPCISSRLLFIFCIISEKLQMLLVLGKLNKIYYT